MSLRIALLASLVAALSGCGDSDPDADAGPGDAATMNDGGSDAGTGDAGPVDANEPDTVSPSDAGIDAPPADGGPDAGPATYIAVAGERCSPETLIGGFSLQGSSLGRFLYGTLSDSPRPWVGQPEEVAGPCAFYQANRAACECSDDLVCTHDRERCVPSPQRVDIGVTVHAGGESHAATPMDDGLGAVVAEDIPLTGDTFGMTVTGLGATITVEPITFPARIAVAQDLTGSYDAPESMDLSWTPEDSNTTVYSLTNINHHVNEPTFTECAADASAGAIYIPGSMLVPLSVSTGLEFQQVESIRFAAAELPEGCVEFRFAVQ